LASCADFPRPRSLFFSPLSLPAGTYTLIADLAGLVTQNTVQVIVAKFPTSVSVLAPGTPQAGAVLMTATVFGSQPAGNLTVTTPSGMSSLLPLNTQGTATTVLPLAAGTHLVNVTYSGDARNAPSAAQLAVSVAMRQSVTSVSTTPNPALDTDRVTLRATVSGYVPTGTVQFTAGSTILATVAAEQGMMQGTSHQTTFQTLTTLPPGVYNIVASYSGDANNRASSSVASDQVVRSQNAWLPSALNLLLEKEE